ncbi:M48 family metallopeptidase [Lampropedia puyangensis]|uniref:M48 family metallopeptidase n=1 Tax=Lampropedia puyangensis TaxID=1330072 RepID=A0A4S8FAP3_9BURK|nr:SprT family zinc-dependent metalloprotease [Lampropedia puyangensis]THU04560.1 M48 family metallopeptidase [Lampropedia puyangensis]
MAHDAALEQLNLGLFNDSEQVKLNQANRVWMHPQANRLVQLQLNGDVVRVGYCWAAAKRRTIGMQISAQGLQVRAPRWVSQTEIEATLQARARWIVQKLQQLQPTEQALGNAQRDWGDGTYLAWQGQWVRLALGFAGRKACLQVLPEPEPMEQGKRWVGAGAISVLPLPIESSSVEPCQNQAHSCANVQQHGTQPMVGHVLYLPVPLHAEPAAIAAAAQVWLRQQALQLLQARTAYFAPLMGVQPSRLSLTSASTRWGSASSTGAVRLHWRLAHMEPVLFDYVLVHELAHLHEMNHSDRFWAWVEHVQPEYAQHRQKLKQVRLEPWI